MEMQKTLISQNMFEKGEKSEDLHYLTLRLIIKPSDQHSVILASREANRSIEQNRVQKQTYLSGSISHKGIKASQ